MISWMKTQQCSIFSSGSGFQPVLSSVGKVTTVQLEFVTTSNWNIHLIEMLLFLFEFYRYFLTILFKQNIGAILSAGWRISRYCSNKVIITVIEFNTINYYPTRPVFHFHHHHHHHHNHRHYHHRYHHHHRRCHHYSEQHSSLVLFKVK